MLNDMILRNKGRAIVGIFVRLLSIIAGRVTPTFVKVIKITLARASGIAKNQGIPGIVKYLKVAGISTAQAIAGYKTNQTPRISRTNSGIPRLFPPQLRRMIMSGHTAAMRLALTLTSLYRDLTYDADPNLTSIVKPYTGTKSIIKRISIYIPMFVKLFVIARLPSGHSSLRDLVVGKFTYFSIFKSSPYGPGKTASESVLKKGIKMISTHPVVMIRSALGLEPEILESLEILSSIVKAPRTEGPLAWVRRIKDLFGDLGRLRYLFNTKGIPSGKLGLKEEAAGKVRVFAMVDPWTQMILRPFHKAIFAILRTWPMDGTFNQLKPLRRAWRFPALFSMDLSSATDRLPMDLQVPIFKELFSMSSMEAEAWRTSMVGRFYRLPFGVSHEGQSAIKYTVGQPMGALSSWAMLALTHHFIVQVAAWETNSVPLNKLFRNYAVLGDDIVIFDAKVAKRYHKIMTALGVECNLAKSIISPNGEVLEFAKRVFYKGVTITPTPLKEYDASLQNPMALYQYKQKYQLKWSQVAKLAGFSYRVVGWIDSRPLNKLSLKIRYLMFVGLIQDPQAVLDSLVNLRKGMNSLELQKNISDFIWNEYQKLWTSYYKSCTRLESMRFAPLKDFMKDNLPDKSQRKLYHDIFWAVYQPAKHKSSIQLTDGMIGLQKIFSKGKVPYPEWELMSKIQAFLEMIKLDSEISATGVDILNTTKHEIVPTNPVQVKLFKIHKAFSRFMSKTKTLLLVPAQESQLARVEPIMSGFVPLHALKVLPRILPRAFKNANVTKIMFAALRRRFVWTAGFTGIMGIASYFQGLPTVIGILLTIWTSVQALLTLDNSSPGWSASGTIFTIVGNVILHSIELYLAGLILVGVYHHGLLLDLWNLAWQAHLQGNISSVGVFVELLSALNRLLIDVGTGVVPQVSEYAQRLVSGNSFLMTYVLGYALSALLIFLIRMFTGL